MNSLVIVILLMYYGNVWSLDEKCDGVIIRNNNHKKEILKSNLEVPYQLAIDYETDTLFFSYNKLQNNMYFNSARINLKNNDFKAIKGIEDGFAAAVDNEDHIVYLGGQNGIYKYNYDTNSAVHINGTNLNIWQLYFKKELYYITYPEKQVYVLNKNGESKLVPEFKNINTSFLAIGESGDFYYANESGVFVHDIKKNTVSYIGYYNIHGFTNDIEGNLMFVTSKALFKINQKNNTVDKIASIDDMYGVAIESTGDIIYSNIDSVIRFKPAKTYCPKDLITNGVK